MWTSQGWLLNYGANVNEIRVTLMMKFERLLLRVNVWFTTIYDEWFSNNRLIEQKRIVWDHRNKYQWISFIENFCSVSIRLIWRTKSILRKTIQNCSDQNRIRCYQINVTEYRIKICWVKVLEIIENDRIIQWLSVFDQTETQ